MTNLWNQEYQTEKNISTSFNKTISRSIQFLLDFLKEQKCKSFLDLGCGVGRNAILLSEMGYNVTGIDTSDAALKVAKERSSQIHWVKASMGEPLPFDSESFDVAMDITTFDNLLTAKEIECHKAELKRVLKQDGYFLYYDMADDDPYSLSMKSDNGIYYTPTGIPYKIYSSGKVKQIFDNFETIAEKAFAFQDKMDGRLCDRKLVCLIMRPKA